VVETVVLSLLVDKGELVLPAVVKLEAEKDVEERLSVPWEVDNDVWFSWANEPPAVPITKEITPANANIAKALLLKFITNDRTWLFFKIYILMFLSLLDQIIS
jgi:hypothetical protein